MKSLFDSQGIIDIYGEVDNNISFSSHGKKIEIIGASLNSILRNLIQFFGEKQIPAKAGYLEGSLPGGTNCWEDVIDGCFVCLSQVAGIDEIMVRLSLVVSRVVDSPKFPIVLCNGVITFITCWVFNGLSFILDRDRLKLRSWIQTLKSQLAQAPMAASHIQQLIQCTHKLQRAEVGISTCLLEVNKRNNQVSSIVEPNIYFIEGKWDGDETKVKETKGAILKAQMATMPKVKLEIFGADMLFDDDSDEDQLDQPAAPEQDENLKLSLKRKYPVTRLKSVEIDLLANPSSLSSKLLDLDLLELARQWTLVDHTLFQVIPFSNLIQPCFSTAKKYHEFEKIFENIRTNGVRKLIDRFNTASTWVSHVILSQQTPPERASTISKFINLASHLHKLGNFHGLMVIITALQQGCIARLAISFDLVPKVDLKVYQDLKVRSCCLHASPS